MNKYRYAFYGIEIDSFAGNCAFGQMISEYSAVEPPVARIDKDFDFPAKYHIEADVELIRCFAVQIFQFQFHKTKCSKAGHMLRMMHT